MRYFVALDPNRPEETTAVDIERTMSGQLRVQIDGREIDVDVKELDGHVSLLIDGRVIDLTIDGAFPEVGVVARGVHGRVLVQSERQRALAHGGGGGKGERVVKSPMPGRVVKVLVKAGDKVDAGDALVVMEAMKMENEIRAKGTAVVREVHVTAGSAVEANAKLITFDVEKK